MPPSAKQNLCFILPSLEGGGAERVFVTLANYFAKKGYKTRILLVKKHGTYLLEVDRGVELIDLRCSRTLNSFYPILSYIRKNPETVYFVTIWHLNLILAFCRVFLKFKLVIRASNTLEPEFSQSLFGKVVLRNIISYFYRLADCVLAPSEGVKEDLVNFFKQKSDSIRVIPNPIDFNKISKLAESLEHGSMINEFTPYFISVGRLAYQKDFETLIIAVSIVLKKQPIRLLILGEGGERAKLEAVIERYQLQSQVRLCGFLDNPFPLIKNAMAFVSSSRFEGMPNAILQAAALEKPIISTNCKSGPAEILENGKWGYLTEVENPVELAQGMINASNDALKVVPLKAFMQKYSVESIALRYEQLILDL